MEAGTGLQRGGSDLAYLHGERRKKGPCLLATGGAEALTDMPIRASKTREFPLLSNWLIAYITTGLIEY